jgi:hypothetical protein
MAKLRHEVNLLNSSKTGDGDPVQIAPELSFIKESRYSGSISYYFEFVARNTAVSQGIVYFNAGGASSVGNIVPASTVNPTLFRYLITHATILSDLSTIGECGVRLNSAISTLTVYAARLIIIQDTGSDPITNSEDQYEIGANETGKINTVAIPLSAPKYWFYEEDAYDGDTSFEAEVVYGSSNNMSTRTITLQEDNGCFAGWKDNVIIVNAGTATTPTRVRVSFTPKPGRNYRLSAVSSSSMDTYDIYCGKIIVTQRVVVILTEQNTTTSSFGISFGSVTAIGQTFLTSSGTVITALALDIARSSLNEMTGIYFVQLQTGVNGPVLGTSNSYNGESSFTTTRTRFGFTFNPPVSGLATGFFTFLGSGEGIVETGSPVNLYSTTDVYLSGEMKRKEAGVWVSYPNDLLFIISGSGTGPITKLQSEYLLINSSQTTSGNKNLYTLFYSGDWSGVTNTYITNFDGSLATGSVNLVYGFSGAQTGILSSRASGFFASSGFHERGNVAIYSLSTGGDNSFPLLGTGNTASLTGALAQAFTASSGFTVIGARFYAISGGNISTGERFNYYCDLTTGTINSPILVSGQAILGSGVSGITPPRYTTFNFYFNSGVTFQSGNSGFLRVWNTSSGYDSANFVKLLGNTAAPYSSGRLYYYNKGATWLAGTGNLSFSVLTTTPLPSFYSGLIDTEIIFV